MKDDYTTRLQLPILTTSLYISLWKVGRMYSILKFGVKLLIRGVLRPPSSISNSCGRDSERKNEIKISVTQRLQQGSLCNYHGNLPGALNNMF